MITSRSVRTVASIGAFAILAGGLMGATPAQSSEEGQVSGVVTSSASAAAAAGTDVEVIAWPSSEVLAGLEVGDRVPTVVIGKGQTDASGRFAAAYELPKDLARYTEGDAVNIAVRSVVDGVTSSVFTSLPTGNSTADAHRNPASLRLITGRPDGTGKPGGTPTEDSPIVALSSCWDVLESTTSHIATVGRVYVRNTGSTATFSYTSGVSNTLGVGVSGSGAAGTWSASGSSTVSSSGTVGFSSVTGAANRDFRTSFNYQRVATKCTTNTGSTITTGKTFRASAFNGGATNSSGPATPSISSANCVSHSAGSSFTKSSTSASTISGGASTSGTIGINLTSEAGYTSAGKMAIKFSTYGTLCGTAGTPGGTPGTLLTR